MDEMRITWRLGQKKNGGMLERMRYGVLERRRGWFGRQIGDKAGPRHLAQVLLEDECWRDLSHLPCEKQHRSSERNLRAASAFRTASLVSISLSLPSPWSTVL